jgi:nucleoporin SEH1
LEIYNASSWQLTEELDVMSFGGITPSLTPAVHTPGIENGSPTSSEGLTRRPSTPSITQASKLAASVSSREAESGWCLSWCKEKWWGEIIAVSAGTSACVKVRRPRIVSIFTQSTLCLKRLQNLFGTGYRFTTGS